MLAKLSKAGLVETATGKAGACWLARDAQDISLLDIYQAVDAPKAFSIHHYTEQKACPVSCHIKGALDKALGKTQKAMEASLADISLAQIVSEVKKNEKFLNLDCYFINNSKDNQTGNQNKERTNI